jgi:transcriptional regulator with XRE-family HTH domain
MGRDWKGMPNKLKLYRQMEGYSQRDVAQILSFKNSAVISSWEMGRNRPSFEYLLKLSILYHTLPAELFCDLYQHYREQIQEAKRKFDSLKQSEIQKIPDRDRIR